MVTTEAVSQRHPALAQYVLATLTLAVALDSLAATILVEGEDGQIHELRADRPVPLKEFIEHSLRVVGESVAP